LLTRLCGGRPNEDCATKEFAASGRSTRRQLEGIYASENVHFALRQFSNNSGNLTIYTFLKAPPELNTRTEKLIAEKANQNTLSDTDAILLALEKQYDKGYIETLDAQYRKNYADYAANKGHESIQNASIEALNKGSALMGYKDEERAECIAEGNQRVRAQVNYDSYSIVIPASGSTVYELTYRSKQGSNPKASDVVAELLRNIEVSP
jgi:predicted nucleic acid-binding protein